MLQMFLRIHDSLLVSVRANFIIIPTIVHCACTVCARDILKHLRLALAFKCCITAAHDRIAQVIEAMVVVTDRVFVEGHVFVTNLHDEFVDVGRHVHQAVHFVKDCDGEDFLVAGVVEVHRRREGVGSEVRYV
jgi:hypothetical protein